MENKTQSIEDQLLNNHNYMLSLHDMEKENRRKKRNKKYNNQ